MLGHCDVLDTVSGPSASTEGSNLPVRAQDFKHARRHGHREEKESKGD